MNINQRYFWSLKIPDFFMIFLRKIKQTLVESVDFLNKKIFDQNSFII